MPHQLNGPQFQHEAGYLPLDCVRTAYYSTWARGDVRGQANMLTYGVETEIFLSTPEGCGFPKLVLYHLDPTLYPGYRYQRWTGGKDYAVFIRGLRAEGDSPNTLARVLFGPEMSNYHAQANKMVHKFYPGIILSSYWSAIRSSSDFTCIDSSKLCLRSSTCCSDNGGEWTWFQSSIIVSGSTLGSDMTKLIPRRLN